MTTKCGKNKNEAHKSKPSVSLIHKLKKNCLIKISFRDKGFHNNNRLTATPMNKHIPQLTGLFKIKTSTKKLSFTSFGKFSSSVSYNQSV